MGTIKESLKITLVMVVAGLAVGGYALFMTGVFAPKFEDLRHTTHKNSQSYNDGMIQQLQSLYKEYHTSDAEGKQIILDIVSHNYADYPQERVPTHLRPFLSSALNPVTP